MRLTLRAPYPEPTPEPRLWRARPVAGGPAAPTSPRTAARSRYDHLRERSPARRPPYHSDRTVYATEPGSAEMPSAGRPISERVLVGLIARGITVAPLVLHAGVSSQEKHEPPMPERFAVPPATARLVNSARAAGARVVAVGTTVVRALETVAGHRRTRVARDTGGPTWSSAATAPRAR